jgi:hypothetical protein
MFKQVFLSVLVVTALLLIFTFIALATTTNHVGAINIGVGVTSDFMDLNGKVNAYTQMLDNSRPQKIVVNTRTWVRTGTGINVCYSADKAICKVIGPAYCTRVDAFVTPHPTASGFNTWITTRHTITRQPYSTWTPLTFQFYTAQLNSGFANQYSYEGESNATACYYPN